MPRPGRSTPRRSWGRRWRGRCRVRCPEPSGSAPACRRIRGRRPVLGRRVSRRSRRGPRATRRRRPAPPPRRPPSSDNASVDGGLYVVDGEPTCHASSVPCGSEWTSRADGGNDRVSNHRNGGGAAGLCMRRDPRRIPSAAPKLSVTQRSLQLIGRQHPAPYCLFCKTTTASPEARRREEHMGLVAGLIGVVGDLLHLLLGGL